MPDARGDVLCPTCGRWTPPAPFCNECGAALQGGFRDPVGGQGSDVFRRGHEVDEPGAPWSGPAERFEPEPEDEAARAAAAAGAAGGSRVDNLSEADAPSEPSWPAEPPPPVDEAAAAAAAASAAATAAAASPAPAGPAPLRRSQATAASATTSAAIAASADADEPAPPPRVVPPPPPPPYRPAQPPEASGGVSGLVFVVFLGLGILALLGGAILGGVFDTGPAAEASPSPLVATSTPEPTTPEPSVAASATTTAAPSAVPSGPEPTTFPDGFVARAESCDEEPSGPTCDNSGAVNNGELWILVSFRHAKPTDTIGIAIVASSGTVQDEKSLSLSFCLTNTDCPGYTYDQFTNLDSGDYDVRVTRNGTAAATTSFRVE